MSHLVLCTGQGPDEMGNRRMAEHKCYMIILAYLTDRERFVSGYSRAVPPLVEKYGGRYVLMGRGAELLEGAWGDSASVVISEWPSKEAAQTFWSSPEYEEAKKLRDGTGTFQVILIEAPQINA